jgi:hypothetical protein
VVHYAAFAAARSAAVWIPANMVFEPENQVSSYYPDPNVPQVFPIWDPTDEDYGPAEGGVTYVIEPANATYGQISSPKLRKVALAAVMACMPICPSRELGLSAAAGGGLAGQIDEAYRTMVPDAYTEGISLRLRRKLAYALQHTSIEVHFYHSNREPELRRHYDRHTGAYLGGFEDNELGWQDSITVTVKHDLALLPGPGRLLARPTRAPDTAVDGVYVYPLYASRPYPYARSPSATMGNEGEESVIPYVYPID